MLSDSNSSGSLQQFTRYAYDSLGRRISKAVNPTPLDAASIEQYVYDGQDVFLDFVDPNGPDPAVFHQTARYLHGVDIDNLLAMESASGTNWVLQDQLGSTQALVSLEGVLVQSIDYVSFGKAIVAGLASTRYLYTGRELDSESGLIYYRARYYDASTGLFTNEDPIRFDGGDTNLYRYVFNAPIIWRDPFGNQVVFDRSDQTIKFPDGTSFPASNNPTSPNADPLTPNGHGHAPNGTFPLGPPVRTGQDINGGFGPKFRPITLPRNSDGSRRTGVGLHSGRANRGGHRARTLGCIRTTDEAMEYLDQHPEDYITTQD